MKILILCLLLSLSVCFTAHSQDSFSITHNQAREAIKAAQTAQTLLIEVSLQKEIIMQYRGLNESLAQSLASKKSQLQLLEKNFEIMKGLYEAEKLKKDPGYSFKAFLKDVQLVGLGVIVGVLAVVL